jgi:outer membrane receptor for ferrienterochelin and colicins
MHYIEGKADSIHRYFEKNNTQRWSTQLALEHKFGRCSHLTFKNSYSAFNRVIQIPDYRFEGKQQATYTELNYANHGEKVEWITGLNLLTDQFLEKQTEAFPNRSYDQITLGAFVQNTVKATEWLHIESGLRYDYVLQSAGALLPRISLLFKINPELTSRLGAGFGYKAPTLFTEETERIQYQGLLPIDETLRLEKSKGVNWDINYRKGFENDFTFSINQLFFYTRLDHPLLLDTAFNAPYGISRRLINMNGHTDCQGAETNLKFSYADFKLFLGYTLTDARNHVNDTHQEKELTPKHRINSVLMYEKEEEWKAGLEAYYFSTQQTRNGLGKDYWLCGFMVERIWERLSVYINFENFLDVRQTRFETIYQGTITNPLFKDIYAPLDGFVINGGIKIKL